MKWSESLKNKFNVLIWDFNTDKIEHYDVLPYFRTCYEKRIEKSLENKDIEDSEIFDKYFKVPKTFDDFKKFIRDESLSQFWSRCEYEMIIQGWPIQKNSYKIDVYEQIMMNIDVITTLLMEELTLNF